jgi:hypothetical protein
MVRVTCSVCRGIGAYTVAALWQLRHYVDTIASSTQSWRARTLSYKEGAASKIPSINSRPALRVTVTVALIAGVNPVPKTEPEYCRRQAERMRALAQQCRVIRRSAIKSKPRRIGPTRLWLESIGERFTYSFRHKVEHRAA